MRLTQTSIAGFRNLQQLDIDPSPQFNLILGPNGAGKTSVLEALHLLSTGHSFRTRKIRELIRRGVDQLSVTAHLYDHVSEREHRAGISKSLAGDTELRLDFEPLRSISEMTRLLPVKALYPDSHKLIQDGPSFRRQFIDWGLFHVEPTFFGSWRQYRRALDQRNRSLRLQLHEREIVAWNEELLTAGKAITDSRAEYVELLAPVLAKVLDQFSLRGTIELKYKKGWNSEMAIEEALDKALPQCQRFRTTTVGPHRAEMSVEINGVPAKQEMSRGQQKLLVYALHFAQLNLLNKSRAGEVIVLCDDLSAELDERYQQCVMSSLETMQVQTYITGNQAINYPASSEIKVFHVDHGQVLKVV